MCQSLLDCVAARYGYSEDPYLPYSLQQLSGHSIRLDIDRGKPWVQIPSGTRIFSEFAFLHVFTFDMLLVTH